MFRFLSGVLRDVETTFTARVVSRLLFGAALLGLVMVPKSVWAHSASTSYLTVVSDGRDLHVQWEIAVRDLDYAIGLDANGDGRITWGELRLQQHAIDAYVLPRLSLRSNAKSCIPGPVQLLADNRGGFGFAALRFVAACPDVVKRLTIRYGLMFELDPQHRGLLDFVAGNASSLAVLSPDAPEVSMDARGRLSSTFAEFFRLGVSHIFSGPDHLLFIAVLLFPAMFQRHGARRWQPVDRFLPAFVETVRILSAFTAAHMITVTAATLGWIDLPIRVIEGAIALTIVATAIDNIFPILPGRRWMLAFGFGLIHGMGFASALGPLDLPPLPLAIALLAFNLGVEAAQILVAVIVLPGGFLMRNIPIYPRRLLPGASGLAALVALGWFANRTLGFSMGSF